MGQLKTDLVQKLKGFAPFEQIALPMRSNLEAAGYSVTFRVDEGGRHWPSGDFQPEALDWFFSEPWQPRN